ncbi:MAG: hypothetical protein WBD25_15860 [Terriglobales bacterium]|jgi:hypothetical protein
MKNAKEEITPIVLTPPMVVAIGATEFQLNVLEKLGRLEAKMDMIVGNGQPGRMTLAEERVVALEKNDLRRTIYDRLITAAITFAISGIIAWHDHLGIK